MFDSKDIQAYQNIKAPSELKQRIAADCKREAVRGKRNIGGAFPMHRFVRSVSLIAACFVLAVAIFSLSRMNADPVTLSYGGRELTTAPVAIERQETLAANPRQVTPLGIPLHFDVKTNAHITVSGGCLFAVSEDGEEILSMGTETQLHKDADLWWAVAKGTDHYELTVNADGEETVFILELNENTPDGVIYKK